MARKLESFVFRNHRSMRKYPWSRWFDGSIWQIEYGADFTRDLEAFRKYIMVRARKRGLNVQTDVDRPAGTITLQAYTRSEGAGGR